MSSPAARWPLNLPLLWRIPAWTAITVVTAIAAPTTPRHIGAAIAVGIAATAMQFVQHPQRRVRQVAVVVATLGGLSGTLFAPSGLGEVATFLAASRLPGAYGEKAVRVLTIIDTIAVAVVVGFVSHSLIGILAGLGIPVLVQRANEHEELIRSRDRAQALLAEVEAGRDAEAQAAALRERGRIARDLHDVLAHTLAGLSVQLQAVRAIAAREKVPAIVLDPIDTAAELARSGLDEARAAVGALRDPIGLGVDAIEALVSRHPGRPTLRVTGSGTVAAAAGHAVYRAVQESLTNAARYAPGAAVSVDLLWSDTCLTTRIADTGLPPGRSAVTGQGTGLGLAGMDERVRAAGGTVHAGPAGAGWQVEVTVPTS
ncbi:histidine kinase [Jatrophihabitans sp.]|uniref:sensor histidine kinase n=1 Tax=Jatrophihabitans sp. TaxID=1932789 RepID=UPI0030C73479|nr:signal transduction histidine kinase [Jatrophihabitans sp.]